MWGFFMGLTPYSSIQEAVIYNSFHFAALNLSLLLSYSATQQETKEQREHCNLLTHYHQNLLWTLRIHRDTRGTQYHQSSAAA